MIDSNLALEVVLSHRLPKRIKTIPLEDSLGLKLAEDIFADMDQPPFHRVSMDGIALRRSELAFSKRFTVVGMISAGQETKQLPSGPICFEVMTGAVLPPGADLVVRYEDLKIEEGVAEIIIDPSHLPDNFHPQGSDYKKGQMVIPTGTVIKATTTAILASVGKHLVNVYELPRIAIISTGDELVDIYETPKSHEIRWSNGISLKQELRAFGFHDVTLHRVRDDESLIKKTMQELLESKDVLLLTGGVSAGKFDFVPKLLKECQVKEIFHKVAQRPGMPLWFGKTPSNCFVFGLPGNPVSCLVNLRKFVVSFLREGATSKQAILTEEVNFSKKLTYYCQVKVHCQEGLLMATPISGNGSGDFFQLRDSDGFIELRPERRPFIKGHIGELYLWGGP